MDIDLFLKKIKCGSKHYWKNRSDVRNHSYIFYLGFLSYAVVLFLSRMTMMSFWGLASFTRFLTHL